MIGVKHGQGRLCYMGPLLSEVPGRQNYVFITETIKWITLEESGVWKREQKAEITLGAWNESFIRDLE